MIQIVAQLIAEKLELKKWSSEVLLAPMGYDPMANKFTLVIKAPNFSRKFFVKVSGSSNLNDLIRQEAESIALFASIGIQGIPQMILNGTQDGRYFIAQEFIAGKRPRSSEGTFDEAYNVTKEWLHSLCSKTAGKSLDAESIVKRAESLNAIISEFFPFSESIHLMEKLAPTCGIPTSWAHGDFCHGNLIIDPKRKLWVTDFASSSPNEPPIDVLDLIVDYDYTASSFFQPQRLSTYIDSFIPREINPLFLLLYFLNRKIAIKVKTMKKLYDELLTLNLAEQMSKIGEAGLIQHVIMKMK
jgi:hypothetical protein